MECNRTIDLFIALFLRWFLVDSHSIRRDAMRCDGIETKKSTAQKNRIYRWKEQWKMHGNKMIWPQSIHTYSQFCWWRDKSLYWIIIAGRLWENWQWTVILSNYFMFVCVCVSECSLFFSLFIWICVNLITLKYIWKLSGDLAKRLNWRKWNFWTMFCT